ncbi:MAG: hypothetical protein HW421_3853 [Ignavibacteria bacterium]|nr:hypothetical protein [Ignavibacteria bacterium]
MINDIDLLIFDFLRIFKVENNFNCSFKKDFTQNVYCFKLLVYRLLMYPQKII